MIMDGNLLHANIVLMRSDIPSTLRCQQGMFSKIFSNNLCGWLD